MKKLIMAAGAFIVIAGLALAALLVGTGPDDANPQPVIIELPDNFET